MYLDGNGLKTFKDAVAIKKGPFSVYGPKIEVVVHAVQHYHDIPKPAPEAEIQALKSILSKGETWLKLKAEKAHAEEAKKKSNDHVLKRKVTIESLLREAFQKMKTLEQQQVAAAAPAYAARKAAGRKQAIPLSVGYANERVTYVFFNKTRSVGGTPLGGMLEDELDEKLSPQARGVLGGLKAQNKTLGNLTAADWQQIHLAAQEDDRKILEVRYMKKRERMRFMLESNGNGGLRYIVSQRAAFTGRSDLRPNPLREVPWAMDEWGNLYCASDHDEKSGFASFNHSTFTAGDDVVCAGMIQIDENGLVRRISNASGHYKPNKAQLQLALLMLITDYNLNSGVVETVIMTPNPAVPHGVFYDVWGPGKMNVFLGDGPYDERVRG